jgi:acyl-coenzyme A thioesterase PaaI-like protein
MSDPSAALVTSLPYPKHTGILPGDDGELVLPDVESVRNHVGTLHAGALFTLGESASGCAVLRVLAAALPSPPLVKSANISYLKPARGRIRASGALNEPVESILQRVATDGKASFDVSVSLRDDAGVEVATMSVTWSVRGPRP